MAATGEPEPEPDGAQPAPETDAPEADVKAKFRAALERKNAKQGGAEGAEGGGAAKVHGGAHGPAHQQRTFRRKSG